MIAISVEMYASLQIHINLEISVYIRQHLLNAFAQPKAKKPSEWLKTYPETAFEIIHQENYLPFIT